MGTNPFEDMYANWLKTLTTQQTSAPQQWQKAMSDFWQMPAAYWQTFGSIMGSRAQGIQQAWEKTPQNMQALASCKSWPEFVGKYAAMQGETLCNLVNLDHTTNAYRAGLWKEWCNLAQRNAPQQQSSSSSNTTTPPQAPPAKQQPAANASAHQPGTFIPGPQPAPKAAAPTPAPQPQQQAKSFITPKQPQPQYQSQSSGQRQPLFTQQPPRPLVTKAQSTPQPQASTPTRQLNEPKAQALPEPKTQALPEMPLLTGTHGHATVSPTANSVMRSASGATLASTAARRSVVARRQSRRRTPR